MNRRRPRPSLYALLGLAALAALQTVPASGEIAQKGDLIVSFGGSIAPTGAPFPLVRASYSFENGTTLASVLVRTCHTR